MSLHMFRTTVFLALFTGLFSATAAAAKSSGPPVKIDLNIGGVMPASPVLLSRYFGPMTEPMDTAYAEEGGKIHFTAGKKYPHGLYHLQFPAQRNRSFDLVLSDDQEFVMESDTSDLVGKMKISGSSDNKAFFEYQRAQQAPNKTRVELQMKLMVYNTGGQTDSAEAVKAKMAALAEAERRYIDGFVKANKKTLTAKLLALKLRPEAPASATSDMAKKLYRRAHFLDKVDWAEQGLAYTPWFDALCSDYLDQCFPRNADSLIPAIDHLIAQTEKNPDLYHLAVQYCTYKYDEQKATCVEAVLFHMVDTYFKSGKVTWFTKNVLDYLINRVEKMRRVACGAPAVNVSYNDSSGRPGELMSIQAKYTLLVFWDPDCSHCQVEIPELKKEYDELKSHGLEVLAVVPSHMMEKWKPFIREHQLNWINGIGRDIPTQAAFVEAYSVYTTPIYILLDGHKNIIAKNLGPAGSCDEVRRLENLPRKK